MNWLKRIGLATSLLLQSMGLAASADFLQVPDSIKQQVHQGWVRDIRTHDSNKIPALRKWIEDLNLIFLGTPTAQKSFGYALSNSFLMKAIFGISEERAQEWRQVHAGELSQYHFSVNQFAQAMSLDFENPRRYAVGITAKNRRGWSGMTTQLGTTTIILTPNQLSTSVPMLEHLIHEAAILLDPRGFDNSVYLGIRRNAKAESRKITPADLEELNGLEYPAIAISILALRAMRFEQNVFRDLERMYHVSLDDYRSFRGVRDESDCRAELVEIAKVLGNFGDFGPDPEEFAQIVRKMDSFKPRMNCLQLTTPNFDIPTQYMTRFPGPRPRLGGG